MWSIPWLSACVITVRTEVEDGAAAAMAAATAPASSVVTQQIVEPEPERKPPSAPAASPAAMTSGRKGMSFCRNGWCNPSANAPRNAS